MYFSLNAVILSLVFPSCRRRSNHPSCSRIKAACSSNRYLFICSSAVGCSVAGPAMSLHFCASVAVQPAHCRASLEIDNGQGMLVFAFDVLYLSTVHTRISQAKTSIFSLG